jgi:OmpA-OmpF porin, OOP family
MKIKLMTVLCASGFLLAGCGTASPGADGSPAFPARDSAWMKEGDFVNVANLRQIRPGMTKNQIYALIGPPHFDEGVFFVRVWNYVFDFRTGEGDNFVTCQYQIRFDDHSLVAATYWKEPDCALRVNPPDVHPIPPEPAAEHRDAVTLGTDGLFRFDGAAEADMLPAGRAQVEQVAGAIRRDFPGYREIVVTGYTDRLGTDAHNAALSLARARTVRALLVRQDLDGSRIRTAGEGAARPIVACDRVEPLDALEHCLQPNRRVEIEIR